VTRNNKLGLRLAAGLLSLAPIAAVVVANPAQAASARRCSQNISTSHSNYVTTVTIITRYCNRSYRAWARFADGKNIKGAWHTSGQSVAYDPNGGNQSGGYQYEVTGSTGPITTHISY
jgi:hypothetical protein